MNGLKVAKVHKIEYADREWMIHDTDHVLSVLCKLYYKVAGWWPYHNSEYIDDSDYFEFDKHSWRKMIEYVETLPKDDWLMLPCPWEETDQKPYWIASPSEYNTKGYSYRMLSDYMMQMLDASDPDNDYISIYWFI